MVAGTKSKLYLSIAVAVFHFWKASLRRSLSVDVGFCVDAVVTVGAPSSVVVILRFVGSFELDVSIVSDFTGVGVDDSCVDVMGTFTAGISEIIVEVLVGDAIDVGIKLPASSFES